MSLVAYFDMVWDVYWSNARVCWYLIGYGTWIYVEMLMLNKYCFAFSSLIWPWHSQTTFKNIGTQVWSDCRLDSPFILVVELVPYSWCFLIGVCYALIWCEFCLFSLLNLIQWQSTGLSCNYRRLHHNWLENGRIVWKNHQVFIVICYFPMLRHCYESKLKWSFLIKNTVAFIDLEEVFKWYCSF